MNISINEINISISMQPKIVKPIQQLYQQQPQNTNLKIFISNSENNSSILIERTPEQLVKAAPRVKIPQPQPITPIRIHKPLQSRIRRRLKIRSPLQRLPSPSNYRMRRSLAASPRANDEHQLQ